MREVLHIRDSRSCEMKYGLFYDDGMFMICSRGKHVAI